MNGNDIESISAIDERSFRVIYKDDPTHVDSLIFGMSFPVVPAHAAPMDAEKVIAMKQMPGSGPYVVGDWDPKQSITFKRLKNWWGECNR